MKAPPWHRDETRVCIKDRQEQGQQLPSPSYPYPPLTSHSSLTQRSNPMAEASLPCGKWVI